jgi:4-hydroxybutyryl-CoA dehydratase/vinylacetyl-CoA-Delta-isomerase
LKRHECELLVTKKEEMKMAVKTREEYVESLRKQKPKVFMAGERVENLVDHPMFQGTISIIGAAYACAHEPKYKELATLDSPLTNERISRWNNIVKDEHDALAKVRLLRQMGDYFSPCTYRCITVDMINAGWVTSYEIDRKYGTDYHQRFTNIVKDMQRNDWTLG